MLLLLRSLTFFTFFQNPKNVTFYVFLLRFIRFLELWVTVCMISAWYQFLHVTQPEMYIIIQFRDRRWS